MDDFIEVIIRSRQGYPPAGILTPSGLTNADMLSSQRTQRNWIGLPHHNCPVPFLGTYQVPSHISKYILFDSLRKTNCAFSCIGVLILASIPRSGKNYAKRQSNRTSEMTNEFRQCTHHCPQEVQISTPYLDKASICNGFLKQKVRDRIPELERNWSIELAIKQLHFGQSFEGAFL